MGCLAAPLSPFRHVRRPCRLHRRAGQTRWTTRGGAALRLHERGAQVMRLERTESRALAAIRFLDAETQRPLSEPITIEGQGLRFARNVRGLHVVTDAPGFSDYAASFELPDPLPAAAAFTLVASDPTRRYLARSFTLELPRDATAPPTGQPLPPDSVFRPVDVTLYPSPLMRPSARSAVVRLRVVDVHDTPLPGALVSLALADPEITRWGLSNERGDALILVPGIPIADWSNPEAPIHFTFSLAAAWAASTQPPDPDALSLDFHPLSSTLDVAAGEEVTTTIKLDWVEL
ncbi:hypothetical protein BHS07_22790 [Myxococcus xanthus]|nr:hypothetical protein BHS07_22790 [Myxococcus xanthus]